ncbi:ATP-binding protein [Paenibacillus sp. GCM10023248]|uniref:ATP-binding protein n=1 Tax=unclassified Paenibacillus TaxID=185978 RepID=UPI0023780CCA|nr:DUF4118 domain-containing protein [Paenibacillus sp. MAHUQ-63]MDD9267017.1 DUF4118 domain-containing protein [Paenibacillus sp. MAHUQ-63]
MMNKPTEIPVSWQSYGVTALFIAVLTLCMHIFSAMVGLVNIALLYLLPVLFSAVRWGRGPSFFAASAGVLAFDFLFVPPVFSLSVADLRYLLSFLVYISVAALTASLASRLRSQFHQAQMREASTAALYELSRKMTAISDVDVLLKQLVQHVSDTLEVKAAIFLPNEQGELRMEACSEEGWDDAQEESQVSIAAWVYRHHTLAGRGTSSLREATHLHVPLLTGKQAHGVLAVDARTYSQSGMPELIRTIEAHADLAAVALSRVKLANEAKVAQLTAESEKLRTALLDSLSHELRTPLAAIIGSVTGLLEGDAVFSPEDKRELLLTIREGSTRMNRLVGNLLGMVRIESGMLRLNRTWSGIDDLIGVALTQLKDALQSRKVSVRLAPDLPSLPLDDVLMEQVLINVISNAIKYSPEGSEIRMEAEFDRDMLHLYVKDEGIGLAPGDGERLFEKFYRGQLTKHIPGTGLGLAICKSIVEAHGGQIAAKPNEPKGTAVRISLPLHVPLRERGEDRDGDADGEDTYRGENINY